MVERRKKALIELIELQELFFETRPKEILDQLNTKKFRLLEFIEFTMEFKFEDNTLFVEGEETILGKFKEKVATLS